MKCVCAEHGRPWNLSDGEELTEICDEYTGLSDEGELCLECSHVKACHAPAPADADSTVIVKRLQEMEYAIDGGNLTRENVPADTISNWFRYVWTGEGFVDVR